MVEVIANTKGYIGGVLREPGERFDVDDELMRDAKRRPRWVRLAAFGGKGDHDGDGKPGGSVPSDGEGDGRPGGLDDMTKAQLVDYAKAHSVEVKAAWSKDDILTAIKAAQEGGPEPFGEAPAPSTAKPAGNGLQDALGGVQPDWVPPGGEVPKAVD